MRISENRLRRMIKKEVKLLQQEKLLEYLNSDSTGNFLAEAVTAGQLVGRIKRDLYILAAKEAGGAAMKKAVEEFGADVVDAVLDSLGAVPGIGNLVSAVKAKIKWVKLAKKGYEAVKNAKEIVEPAKDLLKIAAGEYSGIDDDKVGNNPLAKILNVDDRMEYPLKKDYLKSFAGTFMKHLIDNPDTTFDSVESAAEEGLSGYMKGGETDWSEVEGPEDPA